MTDIVEELRNRTTGIVLLSAPPQFQKDGLCQQAADEIVRLRAENEKLRAALKPFAETDIAFYADEKDYYVCTAVWFSLGQYRAAAAALKETGE